MFDIYNRNNVKVLITILFVQTDTKISQLSYIVLVCFVWVLIRKNKEVSGLKSNMEKVLL